MNLLFLNALKGLKSKKVQMIGIVICIALSAAIYTAMNTSLDRLENKYNSYKETQNVEDFSFIADIDYSKDYTREEIQKLKENELKDLPKEQMALIAYYQMTIGMAQEKNTTDLYNAVKMIMDSSGATFEKTREIVKPLEKKYDFVTGVQSSKTSIDEKKLYKVIPYTEGQNINTPYLIEGAFPKEKNEITVLPSFAKANNINIGNMYRIGDVEYKVVGFAYSPDHIFPLISMNRPMFNEKTDDISYMTEETFNEFNGVKEVVYVANFNDPAKKISIGELESIVKEESINLNPFNAIRLARVEALEAEISTDRIFTDAFLYLLLGICVFIILVITKKRIEDERLQIGVLKALGYRSFSIATSYLVYPIIGSLVGGVIGYLFGMLLNNPLTSMYVSYFNLPIGNFVFEPKYLGITVLIPMIILSILAFLIAMFMLRKKPLELLKEGSNIKVNIFSKLVSKLTRKMSFKNKFRYSLASRSLSKLIIVTLTSFCTGLLIVLILIGMNMFSTMLDKTFDGLNFDNMVSYKVAKNSLPSSEEDLIYDTTLKLERVEKKNGENIKIEREEDYNVTLSGVDSKLNLTKVKDKSGVDLIPNIKSENQIVINNNIKDITKANVSDTLVFKNGDNEYRYEVVGVADSFMGKQAYVSRTGITKLLDEENAYNKKFTNDSKYLNMSKLDKEELDSIAGVFSISELKENMNMQMETSSAIIYIVIAFAAILAGVIVLVIANVVVEENKKTISLMKVMGYENKEISKIVLNIYTPFLIIAYLLSIPTMQQILKYIVSLLVKDMEYAIPIEFSLVKALFGLVALLVCYFVAIFISRKTLNKIPLSVALKRE